MSIKNNYFIPQAAAAANVVATAADAVADALLSNLQVTSMIGAEIADGSGRVIVFVKVPADNAQGFTVRPVADTNGNIKLFSNSLSAIRLARSVNLAPGAVISYVPFQKLASVGDPLEGLKARYKVACSKGFAAQKKFDALDDKIEVARNFGWDSSTGATLAEFDDMLARLEVLSEWRTVSFDLVRSLAQRLLNVEVQPDSVSPSPILE